MGSRVKTGIEARHDTVRSETHPFFDLENPIAIGHRGCAGEAPENTLCAFERGLAQGAAILETDVRLTRDGVPVLIHDADVDRNTEGSGTVSSYTFAELQRLDAGHRFSPDGGESYPFRGEGLEIPSLERAMTVFPNARFNIELKDDDPTLVERCFEIITRLRCASHTLLTAADGAVMEALRATDRNRSAGVALGASTPDVAAFAKAAARGITPASGPMALQVPAAFAGRPLVTQSFIDTAHAHEMQVHVWTINDRSEMNALLDLGVDGLVTDFPGRLSALLEERRGAT